MRRTSALFTIAATVILASCERNHVRAFDKQEFAGPPAPHSAHELQRWNR